MDQIDAIERWLDEYARSTVKVTSEAAGLETALNGFMSHAVLPQSVSEAAVDHDYTLLAMKRYGEGAKDFWTSTLGVMKRLNVTVTDPIRTFISNDLRAFKVFRCSEVREVSCTPADA